MTNPKWENFSYPRRDSENHISYPPPTANVHPKQSQPVFDEPGRSPGAKAKVTQQTNLARTPSAARSNLSSTAKGSGPWKALLNFTTKKHLPLLILSLICSIIVGIVTPAQAYLMGKVFSNFTKFGSGQIKESEFKHNEVLYSIYFIIIGGICWFFSTMMYAGWIMFGELQARSARERLFNALIERDIEWFDQRKDGVGALTGRLQG